MECANPVAAVGKSPVGGRKESISAKLWRIQMEQPASLAAADSNGQLTADN